MAKQIQRRWIPEGDSGYFVYEDPQSGEFRKMRPEEEAWLEKNYEVKTQAETGSGDLDPTAMWSEQDIGAFTDPRAALYEKRRTDPEFNKAYLYYKKQGREIPDKWKQIVERAETAESNEAIHGEMMDWTKKLLKGDFSVSPETQRMIDQSVGNIREPVLKAIDEVEKRSIETGVSMSNAINDWSQQVKKTGLSVNKALNEAGRIAKHTGKSMTEALNESIDYNRQLTEMGLEDINEDLRMNMAEKAAQLGRTPADPEFVKELQGEMMKERQRTGLQFGAMESEARMGIEDRVGTNLMNLERERAGAAERTGERLERAEESKVGIAERTGAARETAAAQRGEAEQQAAQMGEQMKWKYATEFPMQAIQAGQQAIEWGERYRYGMPMQRISAAWAPVTGQQPALLQERMAQPTTTTQYTPGFGDVFGTVAGVGLGAAGIASGWGQKAGKGG